MQGSATGTVLKARRSLNVSASMSESVRERMKRMKRVKVRGNEGDGENKENEENKENGEN